MRTAAWTLGCLLLLGGCMFSEQSFPFDPDTRVVVDVPESSDAMTTRQWIATTHEQLEDLLPAHRHPTLVAEELVTDDGEPIDVWTVFNRDPAYTESLLFNFRGLAYSAQATMRHGPPREAPNWDGLEDVWITVDEEIELAGRLGWVRDPNGDPINATCIVILPGVRGNNNILRVRDLAHALHTSGFHVLTLELRGTGQTEVRYPDHDYTWGLLETNDLLVVDEWLKRNPHVTRTGLVGYSWGSNHVLMTAWADGREDESTVPAALQDLVLSADPETTHYEAGMIAFSPVPRIDELLDKLEIERSVFINPALAGVQNTFRNRMIEKDFPGPDGNLRRLIAHAAEGVGASREDLEEHVRLLPYEDLTVHDRLGAARVPVLIVHASDDPIVPAQDMVDLMVTVDNPNVAGIMLPRGGHIGFAPYASEWYYNLILNYFDPDVGVATMSEE